MLLLYRLTLGLIVAGMLSLSFQMGLPSLLFSALDEWPSVVGGAAVIGFGLLQVLAFLSWDPPPHGVLRSFIWDSKVLLNLPVAVLGHPTFTAMAWLASGMFSTARPSEAVKL
eukprot:RCo042461